MPNTYEELKRMYGSNLKIELADDNNFREVDNMKMDKEIKKLEDLGCPKTDMVNHPPHYNVGGIECIDIIKVITGNYNKPFCGCLVGNIVKYIYRAPFKNGLEDLKKARWYLDKLIETWEEGVC